MHQQNAITREMSTGQCIKSKPVRHVKVATPLEFLRTLAFPDKLSTGQHELWG